MTELVRSRPGWSVGSRPEADARASDMPVRHVYDSQVYRSPTLSPAEPAEPAEPTVGIRPPVGAAR